MIHQLRIQPKFFNDIASGKKTFEIRKNDRCFQIGDYLALNEVTDQETGSFSESGRCAIVRITYILDSVEFCKEGYVTMSFEPCAIRCRSANDDYSTEIRAGGNGVPVYSNNDYLD